MEISRSFVPWLLVAVGVMACSRQPGSDYVGKWVPLRECDSSRCFTYDKNDKTSFLFHEFSFEIERNGEGFMFVGNYGMKPYTAPAILREGLLHIEEVAQDRRYFVYVAKTGTLEQRWLNSNPKVREYARSQ